MRIESIHSFAWEHDEYQKGRFKKEHTDNLASALLYGDELIASVQPRPDTERGYVVEGDQRRISNDALQMAAFLVKMEAKMRRLYVLEVTRCALVELEARKWKKLALEAHYKEIARQRKCA